MKADEDGREERIVWVSRYSGGGGEPVATTECPVSFVSAESRALIEEFVGREALGCSLDVTEMEARRVDGLMVLGREWKRLERGGSG